MGRTVVVVGVTGDVGQGMAGELLAAGHRVLGVGRDEGRLEAVKAALAGRGRLETVAGSVADDRAAQALADKLRALAGPPDAAIVSVNAPRRELRLADQSSDTFARLLNDNLVSHFAAARALVPALAPGGLYLALGGGAADFVWPGYGYISVGQAAQRMLFQVLAEEYKAQPVHLRELMLYSIIAGASNAAQADPAWITAAEVGRHVAAVVANPAAFPGPILALRSREEVARAA